MKKTYRALGLMSGSSLDGLDLAFCEFIVPASARALEDLEIEWQMIAADTLPFSPMWQSRLVQLHKASAIDFVKTDTFFSYYMAELVNNFLDKHQLEPDFIASHGHTIFHYPEKRITSQIGNGAALAAQTGHPVISDFRSMDIALGGQGAPVAPIADRLLFGGHDFYMNIGGIANISCNANGRYIAFDIGPANQVLNALANELGMNYDANGTVAASGKMVVELFEKVNAISYFQQDYPKSLDNQWVMQEVAPIYLEYGASIPDRLYTACRQLALQCALSIQQIIKKENLHKTEYQLFITGGGAFNSFLINCINDACPQELNIKIELPDKDIINYKEAILMALMGMLRLENLPNCMASVTGASFDNIGGAIHQGRRKKI